MRARSRWDRRLGPKIPRSTQLATRSWICHSRTVGNGIGAKSTPRMATGQPANRQPGPAPGAMPFDGDGRVLRTAWDVPARRGPPPPSQLVQPDDAEEPARPETAVGVVARGDGVQSRRRLAGRRGERVV